jgi:hypothetical protein
LQCSSLFSAPILTKKDEFDRVNGLEKAKDIWDTLQRAHEGTKPIKKAKRQLIEEKHDRFVILDDEDPQEMYNRLKKLDNKVRAYGSRRWGDQRVIDRMLRSYVIKDTMVISLIQQDTTFKKMTPNDVLSKVINHEMLVEEAQHVKNLSNGTISSRKQDNAFKASKKSKSMKVIVESSSEEEEDDDDDSDDESTRYDLEEMALSIRRFPKLMGKQNFFKRDKKDKFRSNTKRTCYNCGKYGHYIANCPHEHREEVDNKKKKRKKKKKKKKKKRERNNKKDRHTLARSGTPMMRVPAPIVMV